MRQYLSVVLVVLYSFSILPVGELAKLPFLVEHYRQHKAKDSSMNFAEFLSIHYSQCDMVFPDHDKDMKLPFKSCQSNNLVTLGNVPPVTSIQICLHPTFRERHACPVYLKEHSGFGGFSDVWQPPRLV